MNLPLIGLIIRQERLKRNWSQEGLCKGLCAVSYLCKIEQGQANASPEMLHALFERLNIQWLRDEKHLAAISTLIANGYEAFFAFDEAEADSVQEQLVAIYEDALNSPYRLDVLLLSKKEIAEEYFPIMNLEQKTLWLLTKERYDEALNINPCAVCYVAVGDMAYAKGDYVQAVTHLQHAYDLAARDGLVHLMAQCACSLGNCYSNMLSFDAMAAHYKVANRLAKATKNEELLHSLAYNTAATQLELGQVQQAYDYFSIQENPTTNVLHKLAVCCEKLGKAQEAYAALAQVDTAPFAYPDKPFWLKVCEPVRYRLDHSDYLKHEEYGAMLLSCFHYIRENLPSGYASFHLPWVLEWFKATRQYKQAYELLLDFPSFGSLANS